MTSTKNESPAQPQLTVADLVPLDQEFLELAQSMLPPSLEDEVRQVHEEQALGLLLQKADRLLRFRKLANYDIGGPLDGYYDEVCELVISDEDFMKGIVHQYMTAQELKNGVQTPPKPSMWTRIRERQHEREHRKAHEAASKVAWQQRKADLEELRNKTFEAERPMIDIDDLRTGDQVTFTSMAAINTSLSPPGSGRKEEKLQASLEAVVIGQEKTVHGQALLIRTTHDEERDYGENTANDTPKSKGIVLRLLSTAIAPQRYGETEGSVYNPGKLVQGETLQLLTTEGRPKLHGLHSYREQPALTLDQININGVDVLPPQKWRGIGGRSSRRRV